MSESDICRRRMRVHMGPGKYGFFLVHLLPISWPRYSLFNNININKNRYKFLGLFFTLFIS